MSESFFKYGDINIFILNSLPTCRYTQFNFPVTALNLFTIEFTNRPGSFGTMSCPITTRSIFTPISFSFSLNAKFPTLGAPNDTTLTCTSAGNVTPASYAVNRDRAPPRLCPVMVKLISLSPFCLKKSISLCNSSITCSDALVLLNFESSSLDL
uniref:Uncharacterized protein n=1 Tax=Cucumis sativus TaxID=3659 RepID=A0A0A0LYF7_CUCSA